MFRTPVQSRVLAHTSEASACDYSEMSRPMTGVEVVRGPAQKYNYTTMHMASRQQTRDA